MILIEEQRSTGLNRIANLNQHLRGYALKIRRRNGILRSQRTFRRLALCLTAEFDIQPLVQFNDFRHC